MLVDILLQQSGSSKCVVGLCIWMSLMRENDVPECWTIPLTPPSIRRHTWISTWDWVSLSVIAVVLQIVIMLPFELPSFNQQHKILFTAGQ